MKNKGFIVVADWHPEKADNTTLRPMNTTENENAGTIHVRHINDAVVIQDDGSGNQVTANGRVLR